MQPDLLMSQCLYLTGEEFCYLIGEDGQQHQGDGEEVGQKDAGVYEEAETKLSSSFGNVSAIQAKRTQFGFLELVALSFPIATCGTCIIFPSNS